MRRWTLDKRERSLAERRKAVDLRQREESGVDWFQAYRKNRARARATRITQTTIGGLVNLGNTCFLNASVFVFVLLCLARSMFVVVCCKLFELSFKTRQSSKL